VTESVILHHLDRTIHTRSSSHIQTDHQRRHATTQQLNSTSATPTINMLHCVWRLHQSLLLIPASPHYVCMYVCIEHSCSCRKPYSLLCHGGAMGTYHCALENSNGTMYHIVSIIKYRDIEGISHRIHITIVSWSLTSLFSTNITISETEGHGWKAIPTQRRKASDILISTLCYSNLAMPDF